MIRAYGAMAAGAAALGLSPAASLAATHSTSDGRVDPGGPKRGHAYSCDSLLSRRAPAVPWISGKRFFPARKPRVAADTLWPEASFSLVSAGAVRRFSGNGLPTNEPTPRGAALVTRNLSGSVPLSPRRARRAHCIQVGQPLGIAVDGVPIYPSFDRAGHNLVVHQVADSCNGQTSKSGLYLYRGLPSCLLSARPARRASPLIGYARDGNPIYGPRGAGGRLISARFLDACHGRTVTLVRDGVRRREYRYYATRRFPYTLGCFRGTPSADWRLAAALSDRLRIAATPGLYPDFSPQVTDYVTRCVDGRTLAFQLATPAGVRIAVGGRPALGGTFGASLPIRPGQEIRFTVSGTGGSSTYYVRCLPPDFPAFTSRLSGNPQAAYYVVAPTLGPGAGPYAAIFNADGVPMWWMRTALPPFDAKLLPDGRLAWSWYFGTSFSSDPRTDYETHTLDGRLVHTVRSVGPTPLDGHDLQVLPNGNYLIDVYKPRDHMDLSPYGGPADATVAEGEIQEISPTGQLVWSWHLKDHVALSEVDWSNPPFGVTTPHKLPDGRDIYDIHHLNSLEPLPGGRLIFSARHLDAIYEIDMASGDIVWKLGGTTTPDSLAIHGDADSATDFGGQHDARLLPDGTLTLHDNGTGRGRAPRALRFRIDAAAKRATLLESLSDPEAPSSACCGSARKLPGGDWVMAWGLQPGITELTASGRRVFRLEFTRAFSYRADPVLPGRLSAAALRAGMDAMSPK